MTKALWAAGALVLIGGGYVGGVALTGQQVNKQFDRYVQSIENNAGGDIKVTSSVDSSLFSSNNSLSLEFLNLPEEVIDWAGTNKIDLNVDYSHGFLRSSSVLTLAQGTLLTKIKNYQKDQSIAPVSVRSDYAYNILSSEVTIDGEMGTDFFTIENGEQAIDIGGSTGQFNVTNNSVSMDWSSAPSSLIIGNDEINIGEITFTQTATALDGDIFSASLQRDAQGEVAIEGITATYPRGSSSLSKLLINFEQKVVDDRIVLELGYSADSVESNTRYENYQFENPALELSFDLDLVAVETLANEMGDLQRRLNQGENIQVELLALFNGVTEKGIVANIDKLEITNDGATLTGDAALEMAPFGIQEAMLDRQALLKKADLQSKVLIPKKFIESLPDYRPGETDFLVGAGILVDEGEHFKISLDIAEGELLLNGQKNPSLN